MGAGLPPPVVLIEKYVLQLVAHVCNVFNRTPRSLCEVGVFLGELVIIHHLLRIHTFFV